MIVKQALPFMRSVGAAWPLTANWIRVECEAMKLQHEICPDSVPRVYHSDADLSTAMISHCAKTDFKCINVVSIVLSSFKTGITMEMHAMNITHF